MPQELNFNTSPYFDDFDVNKNFYRVLFKPGYPIQARELNNIQSILQHQIEEFGNHTFKEGSVVIPGQLTYIKDFFAVEIEDNFAGIPVSFYLNELVGQKITGQDSGVTAKIVKVLSSIESDRGNNTLYVEYIDTSSDYSQKEFFDNETLTLNTSIRYGNSIINQDEGFALTINENATSVGSAFSVSNGIYFLRGSFVNVNDELILLDQYSNTPTYRIGFNINEQIITSDADESLTDNSQGYNNFAAPGADRFKILPTLSKKLVSNTDNSNFVQIAEIRNGIIREINSNTQYNFLTDELARRTYDESGDYYVKPFSVFCKESLNDGINNGGIFNEGELTYSGNVPDDNSLVYKITPGKAYVKGYEADIVGTNLLDAPKPRTTKLTENYSVNFGFTPTLELNNVSGSPKIGINTSATLSLRDERVGSDYTVASGNEIGVARIYDYVLEQGGYTVADLTQNIWDLSLFDIQTYSTVTLNEPVTLSVPTKITGKYTGTTAFLKTAVSGSSTITVYEINGNFSEKEHIVFDDADEDQSSRFITSIRNYGISDVKSVFSQDSQVGSGVTFSADTVQRPFVVLGNAQITDGTSGTSTVTVEGKDIDNLVFVNNIVQYTRPGISSVSLAKVDSVSYSDNTFVISGVENVGTFISGDLPIGSNIEVNNLTIVSTNFQNETFSGNYSYDQSLYSTVPNKNVKSVNLENSELTIRKQFPITITNNSSSTITLDDNETFLTFDEENYTIIRSDGSLEILTSDKFAFTNGNSELVVNNLGDNDTNAVLISTIKKKNIKAKTKVKKIVDSIIINKSSLPQSGIGTTTTLNDGLTFGNYPYGTRVQDEEICLNHPEVLQIYGIYESYGINEAETPKATLNTITGQSSTTNDLVIGEELVGSISGAKAIYVENIDNNQIGFIYTNNVRFANEETVEFSTSSVTANISSLTPGSKNIINNYTLKSGQEDTYYDYSRIERNSSASSPINQLKIYFMRSFYNDSDDGDITTVNSYGNFNYTNEIGSISGNRNTDIIDYRPRVSTYSVVENVSSPFEFDGRSFDMGNHSSKDIISTDESLTVSYEYYLPRIDRIYLNKDKTFTIKFGAPSDNPNLPEEISGSMNIANIYLPAYLYNTSDVNVEFIDYKRYQMKDIFRLENRIKDLEYYTTLSLLESKTENLFIDDGTGLNKFKSGFFVDNFTTSNSQDVSAGVKNSIDVEYGELRPAHYTTNLKLEISNGTISGVGDGNTNDDKNFALIAGSNVTRTGDILSLAYSETPWITQDFATRSTKVSPVADNLWEGSLQLTPSVDIWVDTNKFELNNVSSTFKDSFYTILSTISEEIVDTQDGKRLGIIPNVWRSWENVGASRSRIGNLSTPRSQSSSNSEISPLKTGVPNTFKTVKDSNSKKVSSLIKKQRKITSSTGEQSSGDRIINRSLTNYVRSRNISFTSRKLKPYTRVYPFFDGSNVSNYCFGKLIDIQMLKGAFEVGETVLGEFNLTDNIDNPLKVRFRVAQSNHKFGPYNDPTDVFTRNPYDADRDVNIPEDYSTSSTILNIDIESLSDDITSQYNGIVRPGMTLRGLNSKAEAQVRATSLISDTYGTLMGSFRIPNSDDLQFETGKGRFRLTSSQENSLDEITTIAEGSYYSQDQNVDLQSSLRNNIDVVDNSFKDQRLNLDSNINQRFSSRLNGGYRDPLAQTFVVDDATGIYALKVDLFFRSKDDKLPINLEIREVNLGTPTQKVLPFSQVEVLPDDITVSENADEETSFIFESPVYLESQKEYAIVVTTNSDDYRLWISRLGESDIGSEEVGQTKTLVSTQTVLKSLFKSQNASKWTASAYESLKLNVTRATFSPSSGFTQFFNSTPPSEYGIMSKDPLTMNAKKSRISLASTITSADVNDLKGKLVQQTQTVGLATATGIIIGVGGSSFGELNIIDAGIGYTGTNTRYDNVSLRSITGEGINATANITINSGGVVASGATIANGGSGYVIGDILEPVNVGTQSLGSGMKLSVSQISSKNLLVVDNIQRSFIVGGGNSITYINNSGITSEFVAGTDVTIQSIDELTDGRHIKVYHRNHGLHSSTNKVTLENVRSDLEPTQLTATYPSTTGVFDKLFVSSGTGANFATFEGQPVSSGNLGYIRILDEILSYNSVTGDTLEGVQRGRDGTTEFTYSPTTSVEKYELNGISLRRINKEHDLSLVTIPNPIGIDHYHILIDMGTAGPGKDRDADLNINSSKSTGGNFAKASYNIPYELMIPNITQLVPNGTNLTFEAQTISGTSIGSNEVSFVNKGVSKITNNAENYFETQRLIASSENEQFYLNDLPANKSLNIVTLLETSDERISPIIDLSNNSVILSSNRINNPISNYSEDPRINTILEDPNLFTYVTNNIELTYSATSLKVILNAYINNTSDVRLLYSTNNSGTFVPFPGYNNFNANGSTKDERNNNGTSDTKTIKQDVFFGDPTDADFLEYTFSVNDLSAFKSFRIKLIGTSTNQAIVPIVKDFRAIALA